MNLLCAFDSQMEERVHGTRNRERGNDSLRLDGDVVLGKDAGFGGHAEEASHALDALLVEDVVDVGGEVGADGVFRERESAGPLDDKWVDVFDAVDAGLDEVLDNALLQRLAAGRSPDGGDEGEAGEGMPIVGEVVIDEFFSGSLEAIGAFFEGEESGIADEDGGVCLVEHGVEVGGHGDERNVGVSPLVEEDAGIGQGGAAGDVGGYRMDGGEELAGAADEKQRTHAAFGGDGAAGEDVQAGCGGEGGDGDKADVGSSGGQPVSTLGGSHAIDAIAESELAVEGRMFKIPHEGSGI